MTHIIVPKIEIRKLTVRQEGERVLVLEGGRVVFDLPYDAALALSRAIHIKGKQAEQWAARESVIDDQAILNRLGVPLGLTNSPVLQHAAWNKAAWDSDLRRYIRPSRARGIESQETFGIPTVIAHPPKKEKDDA